MVGVLLAAYLLGSIPTGYLVTRWLKGVDIRDYGSGGTGATNVLRTVGKGAGLTVLIIDILKGMAAVLLIKVAYPFIASAFQSSIPADGWPWWAALAGLMALVGHSRSIWIQFTGGKSAASGFGVLLALAWPIAMGAVVTFAVVLAISRIVSLSSIMAALVTIGLMAITGQPLPYLLLAIAGGLYVILRHRTNINRILAGTEPRLGSRKTSS
ncbi:Glycerol-3-phosphate acyltransferase [Halomicronema hongdechloris C2206]|uniref:Glycerol-3-phosphate acyltransferase n=2 Tax=Halomicronema hongdechloris TaxID=1209493 RepID=A0A1Z3HUE9_9CYAN|nr:Glycerol-3-phosphate acyltransferase [Halomicronema hongdechloris C2206]